MKMKIVQQKQLPLRNQNIYRNHQNTSQRQINQPDQSTTPKA